MTEISQSEYAKKVIDNSLNYTGNYAKLGRMLRMMQEDKRIAGISTKGGAEYFGLSVNTVGEFCSFVKPSIGQILIIDIDEIASITIEK